MRVVDLATLEAVEPDLYPLNTLLRRCDEIAIARGEKPISEMTPEEILADCRLDDELQPNAQWLEEHDS